MSIREYLDFVNLFENANRQPLYEARHPIPKLMDWQRYPENQEVDWTGRKKPFYWFRLTIIPRTDRTEDNSEGYFISYNQPSEKDIINRRGVFLGTKKEGSQ